MVDATVCLDPRLAQPQIRQVQVELQCVSRDEGASHPRPAEAVADMFWRPPGRPLIPTDLNVNVHAQVSADTEPFDESGVVVSHRRVRIHNLPT